jgi:hypothetical protein
MSLFDIYDYAQRCSQGGRAQFVMDMNLPSLLMAASDAEERNENSFGKTRPFPRLLALLIATSTIMLYVFTSGSM